MAKTPSTDQKPPFSIQVQYVKDISFENPNPLAVFTDSSETEPAVNIDIQVKANPAAENLYEVILELTVNANRGENVMYVTEIVYGSLVSIAEDLPKDLVGQVLMVYVPTMLFPFVRNIVADLTRDGGYMPLMLTPVDFMALFQNQNNDAPVEGTA
jgi:preprotein translocase subunit SecB